MKIKDLLKKGRPAISFEFFPPKTAEGFENLMGTITNLKPLGPSFVSMTYGAGGSTRQKTVELVAKIKNEIGLETMAHLTCVGHSQDEIKSILAEYENNGIENVLALRGDPPKDAVQFQAHPDGFHYASELVLSIRRSFPFCIGVAGYPEKHVEALSLKKDLGHLKEKIEAGGDFIITQLFFNNEAYYDYVRQIKAMGLNIPVIAGIMPITDADQIKRFAQMCGAKLPAPLITKLEAVRLDKEGVVQAGIDHAIAQCRDLLKNGAPGVHFYTLNKSHSTKEIFLTLKKEGLVN